MHDIRLICVPHRYPALLLLISLLLFNGGFLVSVDAQPAADPLELGRLLTGRIDDTTPRVTYTLDASRGEVIHFRLQATDGDLDPVLLVFDDTGQILVNRDDHQGSRHVDTSLAVQRNGRLTIVVARFGQSLGSTAGSYEFTAERIGVLSDQGSTLQYGEPVLNTITNTIPQIYYTVRANRGDILDIEMIRSSGNLDPYLKIVDSDRFLVAENDDAPGLNTRNARVENWVVERSGTYIIVATRYGEAAGDSVGGFALVVDESRNSGLGNNRQTPATIAFDQSRSGTLSNDRYQRYYRFTAERNQLVTITMERTGGLLDAYLVLANAGYQPIANDDDGGSGQNARLDTFRIPADGTYHIIATRFGGADGDTEGDYRVTLLDAGQAFAGIPDDIPRLLYGTSVPDAITTDDPESLYVFWGTAGEVVDITMNRQDGSLDPVLELLDADRVRILRDDDSGSGSNARIEDYTLPYTGVYYIRATRYEGSGGDSNTTGRYNLVLLQRDTN